MGFAWALKGEWRYRVLPPLPQKHFVLMLKAKALALLLLARGQQSVPERP